MHLMIDFETLSLKPNAVILQFGAVAFNPDTGAIIDTFFANVDPRNQPGRDIDANTVLWWFAQDEAARGTILDATKAADAVLSDEYEALSEDEQDRLVNRSAIQINHVVQAFLAWVDHLNTERSAEHGAIESVWSQGSVDHAWLDNMLEYVGFKNPIPFYLQRDLRTLIAAFPDVSAPEFKGTKHNALDDAMYQTARLLDILGHIRGADSTKPNTATIHQIHSPE